MPRPLASLIVLPLALRSRKRENGWARWRYGNKERERGKDGGGCGKVGLGDKSEPWDWRKREREREDGKGGEGRRRGQKTNCVPLMGRKSAKRTLLQKLLPRTGVCSAAGYNEKITAFTGILCTRAHARARASIGGRTRHRTPRSGRPCVSNPPSRFPPLRPGTRPSRIKRGASTRVTRSVRRAAPTPITGTPSQPLPLTHCASPFRPDAGLC